MLLLCVASRHVLACCCGFVMCWVLASQAGWAPRCCMHAACLGHRCALLLGAPGCLCTPGLRQALRVCFIRSVCAGGAWVVDEKRRSPGAGGGVLLVDGRRLFAARARICPRGTAAPLYIY